MNVTNNTHLLRTTIALLKQHSKLHGLSLGLTLLTGLVLLSLIIWQPVMNIGVLVLVMVLTLGLMEAWLATRVGFDLALLENITQEDKEFESELDALDVSLLSLDLIVKQKTGRPLPERLCGCLRLLRLQAGVMLFQYAVIIVAILWYWLL